MFHFFTSHQTAPETPDKPITREDFFLAEVDQLTVREVLGTLRRDTIEFTEKFDLAWAVTDFNYKGIMLRVKLTESQDVVYTVQGESTFDLRNAIDMVQAAVQF